MILRVKGLRSSNALPNNPLARPPIKAPAKPPINIPYGPKQAPYEAPNSIPPITPQAPTPIFAQSLTESCIFSNYDNSSLLTIPYREYDAKIRFTLNPTIGAFDRVNYNPVMAPPIATFLLSNRSIFANIFPPKPPTAAPI